MKRVRYDGRGVLRVFGQEVASGQVGTFTDEQADALSALPHTKVTVLGVTIRYADGTSTHSSAAETTSKTKKRRTTKQEE